MSAEPRNCWGCGVPIVFKTMGSRQVVAFSVKNPEEPHSCPRRPELPPIFLPAMQDYRKQVECPFCHEKAYPVPARNEMEQFDYMLLFDRVRWPWEVHKCGILPGIWDYKLNDLMARCLETPSSGPFRLVTVVCAKRITGPDNIHLIALKSVLHERSCSVFAGWTNLVPGDLAVLSGSESDQKLLIASSGSVQTLKWDGDVARESLYLPRSWLDDEA
jgi:hypothetical protein